MGLKRECKLPVSRSCMPRLSYVFASAVVGLRAWYAFSRDVTRILARPTLIGGLGAAVMVLSWKYRSTIEALVGYPVP
jgi:hypothetical protein